MTALSTSNSVWGLETAYSEIAVAENPVAIQVSRGADDIGIATDGESGQTAAKM